MPKHNPWSVKKTTNRSPEIKQLEDGDIFYAWASYKSGGFDDVFKPDLDAKQFRDAFSELISSRYDAAWLLSAKTTKRGVFPVGMALGFWPHRIARPFLVLDALVWFPWASARNRVESTVEFLNKMRREIQMIGFARAKDKRFMETLARHGIGRRIGTSMSIFADGPASVWETNKD